MNQAWKVLVVDDESAARRNMLRMIDKYPGMLQNIGEASSGAEAIQLINTKKPDLVFLDIQLQDMTGFDVLQKISHQPDIIFATAYETYAIKAFETLAVDYLLKPVREERFAQSMEKLKRLGKINTNFELTNLKDLIDSFREKKTPAAFPVKIGDKIILLSFADIAYMSADDKYVNIFNGEGQKYLTDIPLNKMGERLPAEFIRIQKSYIVNKNKIKEMHKHFNGRFIFILNDKPHTRLSSGLTYYDSIRSEFGL
jgi:two-component system LytT family response regulator